MSSTQLLLEQDNNRRAEQLSHKVTLLKSYAKEIDDETKSQNAFLNGMQNSFENASGWLGDTLHRVMGIPKSRSGNRKLMCYVILGVVVFVLVFYYMVMAKH